MYVTLLYCHTLLRWLVLASLVTGIYKAWRGYTSGAAFSAIDNAVRHWTATIAHVQLTTGMVLYFKSPLVAYFRSHFQEAMRQKELLFFGAVHALLMVAAVVIVTIGSASAKRKQADGDKFRTMLIWFSVALLIICIAIPWPFSPFANRPYFR